MKTLGILAAALVVVSTLMVVEMVTHNHAAPYTAVGAGCLFMALVVGVVRAAYKE
jgi:hypothetical protein